MAARRQAFMVPAFVVLAACAARAQEVPPPTPPPGETLPAQVPMIPVTVPAAPQDPPPVPPPTPPVAVPERVLEAAPEPSAPLTPQELRQRRNAIFLMEGVLVKAVRLAAGETAQEIQSVQPGISMFTSSPAKALGTYLEGYGVFFQVEIPSVMPSVVSLVEALGRDRAARGMRDPAQPTSVSGASVEALMNPDAHYVESVKRQLIDAMVFYSSSMALRPDEWLTVAAREAQEAPGQVDQPSTLILRLRGADLEAYLAGRLSRDEIRRRVQVRGF